MRFDADIYALIRVDCSRSAAAVVPEVQRIVQAGSVLDVGGGEGSWAAEFAAPRSRLRFLGCTPVEPLGKGYRSTGTDSTVLRDAHARAVPPVVLFETPLAEPWAVVTLERVPRTT